MRRKLGPVVYFFSLIIALCLLFYICFEHEVNEVKSRLQQAVTIENQVEAVPIQDATAPQGIRYTYEWEIKDISELGASVCFYTIHENVKVWLDGIQIYSSQASWANAFGKTTGCGWPAIHLSNADNGKTIRVEVTPIYSKNIGSSHEFYIGSYSRICGVVLMDSLAIMLLSICSGIMGVIFIAFVIFYRNNQEVDRSLLYLGIFAIEMGLWKFSDMVAADLIFPNSLGSSALSLLSLAALPGAFILFIKRQFHSRDHMVWNILSGISSAILVDVVVMQVFGVADLRETLWVIHVSIGAIILAIMVLTVLEARRYTWSKKLRVTLCGIALCCVGASFDLMVYYATGSTESVVYALFAFLIYTFLMGFISIKDARTLMERGKEAKYFRELALHDQLTGLYNRSYYKQYLDKMDHTSNECIVVMFDVNRLKVCNDTYGHAEGDYLLRSAARIIQQCFGEVGACCRLGGDEFCVLAKRCKEDVIVRRLKEMQMEIADHNRVHSDNFPIEMAYGYAVYDAARDASLDDTIRRADKLMYLTKARMKNEEV